MQTHSRALWKPCVNPLSFLNTNSHRISGLDQEPVNPPAVGNATLSPVGVENPACVNVPLSRDLPDFWIWVKRGPTGCEWEQPPSSSSPARAAQAGPGECHTWDTPREPWGAAMGIYPKKHAKSHLFHHHLKEREGNLCKVFKGAGGVG